MPRWDTWKQARRALNVTTGLPARWRGIGAPRSTGGTDQSSGWPYHGEDCAQALEITLLPDLVHDCVPMCDAVAAGPPHHATHRLAMPHTPRTTFPRRGSPERERTQVRRLAQLSIRRAPQELVGSRLLHSGCSGLLQGASTHTNGGLQ